MRTKGKLVKWDSQKGFGFIAPIKGNKQIFIHKTAFYNKSRTPVLGDIITFELSQDSTGRTRAIDATFTGETPPQAVPRPAKRPASKLASYLSVVFLVSLCVLWIFERLAIEVIWGYLALSVMTFFAYVFDKSKAEKGQWRTTEQTLHILSLLGGWPGAAFAQRLMHHKIAKQSFQAGYWLTILLNLSAFAYLLYLKA